MNKSLLAAASLIPFCYAQAFAQAVTVSIPNNTSTGTNIGSLAKLTGAPSTAITTATTDTSGILGVVVGWTGTQAVCGNAIIAMAGLANLYIDGGPTAGDYIINSPTVSGYGHDVGVSPVSGQVIGRVLATSGVSGLYQVALDIPASAVPVFGAGVVSALGNPVSTAAGLTLMVASGQIALGTSAIASGACASLVSGVATNVLNTDTLTASFSGSPIAQAGFLPGSMLSIVDYPSSNAVNFYECNNTGGSITPAALSINWKVVR